MFYVINTNDTLSLYNDNKQLIDDTLELMPQLAGQPILETDYVTASELSEHPNKMIVGDIEIPVEVPEYDEEGNPIMIEYEDTETVIDYDEEGNPIGSHEITVIKHKQKTHTEIITVKGLIPNPNYEQEEEARREAEFNKAFFNTSLGYIRRSVTMADGSHKDFLSDLLPVISMGVQAGQSVNILAYDAPPFDEDVTDWTKYQHQKIVTAQFIQECFLQLSADFGAINKE